MSAQRTAEFLFEARQTGTVLEALPEDLRPRDVAGAYAAQAALVEQLIAAGAGTPVGYKVGCTNRAAMDMLGASGPFFGRLLSASVHANGADVSRGDTGTLAVEPEYAYVVGKAMPAGAEPWDRDSVTPFLRALVPAIELVGGRYLDITAVGVPSIVAENALNAGWIAGTELQGAWADVDLEQIEVDVRVDEALRATGSAANVLGHPLNVVAWLANELNEQGGLLEAGDYISTGTCSAVEPVAPGEAVRCNFGQLGAIEIQIVA